MPASVDLREGMAEAFDALTEEFQSGVTVTLVRSEPNSQPGGGYEVLLAVTSKRFWEYSNFRKNFLLEIADDNGTLTTAILEATHVQIDSDYYVINTADTKSPAGTNPVWQIYCDLTERSEGYVAYSV